MSGGNIYRNPARRFYDPEISTTAIYMPRTLKQKNRWRRWFFDHDEFIGAVLELHSELPHSRAEVMCEDKMIKNEVEECFEKIKLFSMLPKLDLEYMKIGEIFIHTPWDATLGRWSHIIPHNPDFVEVSASPFVDDNYVVELIPDDQLRAIVNSTRPQDQNIKRRLPVDVIRRVNSGRNLILDPDEVTHLARKSNPYDLRGTSIIDRLFRCYIPGTPVRLPDGTLKNIEQMQANDTVISKHGELQSVVGLVEYDVNTTLVKLRANKARVDLVSTERHEYLVRRQMCACGCGNRLNTEQIKRGSAYIGRHLMRDLNAYGTNKSSFSSEKKYEIIKIAAKDIEEFDSLLIPISKDVIAHSDIINKDRARLLGYYLAEGCHVNEGREEKYPTICWTFCIDERDTCVKDIVDILLKEFNISAGVNKDGKNALSVQINKREDYNKFSAFIRTFIDGNYSHNKKLSADFMRYSPDIQEQLLIGEFRGDGWYQQDSITECRACTVSKELAEQLEWLLIRSGYYAYITKKEAKENILVCGNICNAREAYHINIAGGTFAREFVNKCWGVDSQLTHKDNAAFNRISELSTLGKNVGEIARILNVEGFIGCEGGKFYNETVSKAIKNNGYGVDTYQYDKNFIEKDENYFYVPIVVKESIPYIGKVYDIEVTNEHWWLADKFVTSNTLMYEDKLREAQITIADNFVYPLKIFKLGDPQKGWIPNESHQSALASMLQQATLDPNFALIYHYGLQVDYVTVADKVMKLDNEWTEINNKKAIALGVSQQFITGDTTYASANVGLQTQLARYKAKRDMFEIEWIRGKLLKVMAERNGWYKRDKKELVGQYRVTRSASELKERLIIPKLVWHKKLMMRDDQSFLTFLNNVYANGKGPVSTVTMLQAIGLEIEDELTRKKLSSELEERVGVYIQPPSGGGAPGGMPGIAAKFKNWNWSKQGRKQEISDEFAPTDSAFTGAATDRQYTPKASHSSHENKAEYDAFNYVRAYNVDEEWYTKLNSFRIPENVPLLFKRAEHIAETAPEELNQLLSQVYMQGKTYAYNKTNFVPYTNFKVAGLTKDNEFTDYSDVINCGKFDDWLSNASRDGAIDTNCLRSMLTSVFAHGQITGYEEQGIFNVRVSNVPCKEGYLFKSGDLLKNGVNIALFLSPDFDVPLFQPHMSGISEEELELNTFNLNTPDAQVKPYKTFYVQDVEVEKCPIELIEESGVLFNKIYKLLKNDSIDTIVYSDEITSEPEWESETIQAIKKELKDTEMDDMAKNIFISAQLNNRRTSSRGLLKFVKISNKLYISNRVIYSKKSLTDQLFDEYKIFNIANSNLINSKLAYSKDLSKEEIDVCILYNYVIPVFNESKDILGYKLNADLRSASSINPKLVKNGVWDGEGKLLEAHKSTPLNVFKDNINNYVNYPFKVSDEIKICLGKING
jgi:intein/homing endonuclease